MDARRAVLQQLEILLTEVEALRGFLDVLDTEYVQAEPGGKKSIVDIFKSFLDADHSFLKALGFESTDHASQLPFPELLDAVKSKRAFLLKTLESIDNFDHIVEVDDSEISIAELGREIALANAAGLKIIAYRFHESQNFFKKS